MVQCASITALTRSLYALFDVKQCDCSFHTRDGPFACAGAAAGATQQEAFSLKGLWDSLPLSLYLQACGSAAARDAVSALDPDTDKVMGKLRFLLEPFTQST